LISQLLARRSIPPLLIVRGNLLHSPSAFADGRARFGPTGIRLGSRRLSKWFSTDIETGFNALNDWARIVDCGDVRLLIPSPRPNFIRRLNALSGGSDTI